MVIPQLEEHDISYLRNEYRKIEDARKKLKGHPMNERVRNALFNAGVHRIIADNADVIVAETFLKDRWDTIKEITKGYFNPRHVDLVCEQLEKEIKKK